MILTDEEPPRGHFDRLRQWEALLAASINSADPVERASLSVRMDALCSESASAWDATRADAADRVAICDERPDANDCACGICARVDATSANANQDLDHRQYLLPVELELSPTPKEHMPKTHDYSEAVQQNRLASLEYLRPFGGPGGHVGASSPDQQARFDAALEAEASTAGGVSVAKARLQGHLNLHLASVMPIGDDGQPCMPRNAQEQARFDAKVEEIREQRERDAQRAARSVVRLDGATKFKVGKTEDDAVAQHEGRGDPDEGDAVARARRRMNYRMQNAWRQPLDKEGQQRLDEQRLLRDEDEAGLDPDAA